MYILIYSSLYAIEVSMGCVCCKECCQGGTYDVAGRRIRRQDGEEGEWRVRGRHVLR